MAKIPFSIKYRPQIESGEYKVKIRDGRPARIICWDRAPKSGDSFDLTLCVLIPQDNGEGIYYYNHSGKSRLDSERFDLFIVTPEEELSEFEKAVGLEIFDEPFGEEHIKVIKEESAKLLAIARNEIVKSGYAIIEGKHYLEEGRKNYERGKAEALKDLPGIEHILQERIRQIRVEGFSWRHDDAHDNHQLSDAAIVYAAPAPLRYQVINWWPWDKDWLKEDKTFTTEGRIKELSKAGALIAAEIDRLQRKLEKLPGFKEDESHE